MYKKINPSVRKPFEKWTYDEFVKEVTSNFVQSEDVADAMYFALKYNQNCLLYGPKGHAKTDIVDFVLAMITSEEDFYKENFMLDCGPAMDIKPIMGFLNLPVYRDNGTLEYVLDKSMFVSFKRARLDEIFQAPDQLLLFMRSVISTGKICPNDGVCYPSQMGTIFACTNVNPTDWAGKDEVRCSFVDRFTKRIEVKWKDYTQEAFAQMFKARTGESNPVWAEMSSFLRGKVDFSPRSAMIGLDMYNGDGLRAIKNFDGIDSEIFSELENIQKNYELLNLSYNLAEESVKIAEELRAGCTAERARELHARSAEMEQLWRDIKIPADAPKYEKLGDTKKRISTNIAEAFKQSKKHSEKDGGTGTNTTASHGGKPGW